MYLLRINVIMNKEGFTIYNVTYPISYIRTEGCKTMYVCDFIPAPLRTLSIKQVIVVLY